MKEKYAPFKNPKGIEIAFGLDKGTILKYEKSKITCSENVNIDDIEKKINNCLEENNKKAGIMVDKMFYLENTLFISFGHSKFDSFVKEQCDKVNFKESYDSDTDNKIEIKSSNSGFFKKDLNTKEYDCDDVDEDLYGRKRLGGKYMSDDTGLRLRFLKMEIKPSNSEFFKSDEKKEEESDEILFNISVD